MTHTHLTRWIEVADERHFCETAMFNQAPRLGEHRQLRFGAIARLPARIIGALTGQRGQLKQG